MTTMRSLVRRGPLLPAVLLALVVSGRAALSDTILYEPTAYYVPTAYVSSSYYVPSSYYVSPTAYVVPTTYYVPTRYVVRRYRPVAETSYRVVPTRYYLPTTTTLDLPVLRTSATVAYCDPAPVICEPAPAAVRPLPPPANDTGTAGSASDPDATGAGEGPRLDPGTLNSTPIKPRPKAGSTTTGGATPSGVDPDAPIVPPPGEINTSPPAAPPTTERDAYKPKAPSTARSTLNGRVLSVVTGQPEKNVVVTIANAVGRFKDKSVTTDDQGGFSVVLPESDWTVKVPKTDGSGTIDTELTVSGGLVTNDQNREVSQLTINR
jgi:hypothetical protein